jgi:hypothetical protein
MDHDELTPAERAELDELHRSLADPAVWVEPHPDLQEQIVAAIGAESGRRRPRRYVVLGAAAVVLAASLAAGITLANRDEPVTFAASLKGTELAPAASGEVTLTKTASGWKITLHADGLPRRANGEYYEAWLKDASGALVPVGTFNDGANVTLWAGVPPTAFPTFTITRQLAGGGPASTGQVVLVGITKSR